MTKKLLSVLLLLSILLLPMLTSCDELFGAPSEGSTPSGGETDPVTEAVTEAPLTPDPNASVGLEMELSADKTYYIVKSIGTCSDTALVIPNVHEGLPVKEIAKEAFMSELDLTSVIIPDTVTTVGEHAFWFCEKLIKTEGGVSYVGKWAVECDDDATAISLRADTVGIADGAFGSLKKLKQITLPEGLKYIGADAFAFSKELRELVIPNSVVLIGKNAADFCRRLATVVIGDGVSVIEANTFNTCDSLVSVTLGKNLKELKQDSFSGCMSLVEIVNLSSLKLEKNDPSYVARYAVDIHSGTSKIVNKDGYLFFPIDGAYCLVGHVGEETELTLPQDYEGNTYEIYKDAFSSRDDITKVTISNGVTVIGETAFSFCDNLKTVEFGSSLKKIDNMAFSNCKKLEKSLIPEGVTEIGYFAFTSCSMLAEVSLPSTLEELMSSAFEKCPLILESENGYDYVGNWLLLCTDKTKTTVTDLREDTVGIAGFAFQDCTEITEVVLPASVEQVGMLAFYDCKKIVTATVPTDAIDEIFSPLLTHLIITNGTDALDVNQFKFPKLETIVIPTTVTELESIVIFQSEALVAVYYLGTEAEWDEIELPYPADEHIDPKLYYFSQDPPTDDGNYWHYDSNGEPVIWETAQA